MGTSSQTRADLGQVIASGIARRMEALGWDFDRLAAESGIEQGTLASCRADAGGMGMNELAAVAEALGTGPSALMAEESTRERFGCPAWCVRDDHARGEEPVLHYGPAFGPVWPQGTSTDDLAIAIDSDAVDEMEAEAGPGLAAEMARNLGRNLLAAAEWLEGVR